MDISSTEKPKESTKENKKETAKETDKEISNTRTFKALITNKYGVACIAVFCSILWGSAFPVLKVTYQELTLNPNNHSAMIILAAMRFMLAGIMLLALIWLGFKQSLKVERKFWPALIIMGILQISLQYFFFYNGLAKTTGMKGAILQSCSIFFVVVLAHIFYKNDSLTWKKAFGLITGFAGIVLVNWGQEVTIDFTFTGEGYLILSGFTSAIATIMAKKLTQDINAFLLTGWQMVVGAALLFAAGFIDGGSPSLDFTPLAWGLLIYSAFLSATAYSLWYAMLEYNKAGEIAIYRFMIPVSGAILSSMFIPGENLNMMVIQALFLVALGILAVNHSSNKAI